MEILLNLNLWSIILGLLAWLMGIWAIGKYKLWKPTVGYFFCAVALLIQLFVIKHEAFSGDYAAIEDTIRAIVFAGVFMMAVTVILNVIAYFKSKNAERKAKKETSK